MKCERHAPLVCLKIAEAWAPDLDGPLPTPDFTGRLPAKDHSSTTKVSKSGHAVTCNTADLRLRMRNFPAKEITSAADIGQVAAK